MCEEAIDCSNEFLGSIVDGILGVIWLHVERYLTCAVNKLFWWFG